MDKTLRTETPIARKEYNCDAWEWLINDGEHYAGEFTFAELRSISRAKKKNGMIMPGERYYKAVGIWCGDFGVYRAIPEINDICIRLDMFEEVC